VRWVYRPRPVAGDDIRAGAIPDQQAKQRRESCDRPSTARLTTA
jgi:hypothetical protein